MEECENHENSEMETYILLLCYLTFAWFLGHALNALLERLEERLPCNRSNQDQRAPAMNTRKVETAIRDRYWIQSAAQTSHKV